MDSVTLNIFAEVQNELLEEGIEISVQEIGEIYKSQFIAGTFAFKKGLDIRLPLFGTFTKTRGVEMSVKGKALKELKDTMSEEEYERKVLEAKLENKAINKARKSTMKKITFSELAKTVNVVEVKHRFDKLL
jgi:hypothetical protein